MRQLQGYFRNEHTTQQETPQQEKNHGTLHTASGRERSCILEVQRGGVICPESHSTLTGDPGFELKSGGLRPSLGAQW